MHTYGFLQYLIMPFEGNCCGRVRAALRNPSASPGEGTQITGTAHLCSGMFWDVLCREQVLSGG